MEHMVYRRYIAQLIIQIVDLPARSVMPPGVLEHMVYTVQLQNTTDYSIEYMDYSDSGHERQTRHATWGHGTHDEHKLHNKLII